MYAEYQIDWVFDVAITAWHLVDWFTSETNAQINATQALLKSKSSELAVCEQICNGAKPRVLKNQSLVSFNVATDVQAIDAKSGIVRDVLPDSEVFADIILTPQIIITDKDGTCWDTISLFHRVIAFWKVELDMLVDQSKARGLNDSLTPPSNGTR